MSDLAVLKFGGTSVKNVGRIQHVAKIIDSLRPKQSVLAVVSAMGDTTDHLLKLAKQCSAEPDKRELDLLLSTGEQVASALLTMTLRSAGINACSFTGFQVGIFTESVHNKARIVKIELNKLTESFQKYDVIVVAGFQGVTADGDITTLGRGGSDTTAVAMAAAMTVPVCDIYTDVDGIFTTDPNLIPTAQLLDRISYSEVLEMARLGAQVIHPRAVELAKEHSIKLRIRNTFKPEHLGTIIDGGKDMEIFRTVSGVAVDHDQARVVIVDVPDQPGIAAKITQALADHHIAMDMIMQSFHPTIGLNNIAFTVHSNELEQAIEALSKIKDELEAKEVISDGDIAKVSLIGTGIAGQPAIAAKLFTILGDGKINMKMIASSEMKITVVVKRNDAQKAAQLIHDAFELSQKSEVAATHRQT